MAKNKVKVSFYDADNKEDEEIEKSKEDIVLSEGIPEEILKEIGKIKEENKN